MFKDFVQGLNVWLIGWRTLFSTKSLLVVAIIPYMISLVSAVASIWCAWVYYPLILATLTPAWVDGLTGVWRTLIYYPMAFIGGFVALMASLYIVYVLHALVAIPFYSALAERTLKLLGKSRGGLSPFNLHMLRVGLVKSVIFLFLGVIIFAFSFVPVLNIITLAGTLSLLAFDCMDYSLEARGLGFRQRLNYALTNKAQWAGMAVALALTLLIPGLTLLVIPGAVVGAAVILKDKKANAS